MIKFYLNSNVSSAGKIRRFVEPGTNICGYDGFSLVVPSVPSLSFGLTTKFGHHTRTTAAMTARMFHRLACSFQPVPRLNGWFVVR